MQFMMLIEVGQSYHWSEGIYDFFLKALKTLKHHYFKKQKGEIEIFILLKFRPFRCMCGIVNNFKYIYNLINTLWDYSVLTCFIHDVHAHCLGQRSDLILIDWHILVYKCIFLFFYFIDWVSSSSSIIQNNKISHIIWYMQFISIFWNSVLILILSAVH